MLLLFPLNLEATAAEKNKRPEICNVRFTPSNGSLIFSSKSPNSNINRFDENSPLVKKYRSKLIDVLYEAVEQKYEFPSIKTLVALLQSFNIVDKYRLSVKSISPINEGGVAFDMMYGHKYINVQFDNENDAAIYIEEKGSNPKGWDLNFKDAIKRLEAELS